MPSLLGRSRPLIQLSGNRALFGAIPSSLAADNAVHLPKPNVMVNNGYEIVGLVVEATEGGCFLALFRSVCIGGNVIRNA